MMRTTIMKRAIRGFSSNARYTLPPFENEKFLHYPKGSKERALLEAELKRVVEVPCVVAGKEIFTGDVEEQVCPSDHGHVIARFHKASPELMKEAIQASFEAKTNWANTPFEHRAMVFKKAGDLIAGKYRPRIMATTMLGTGKTVWQAEIDAAVESVDFLRLNNKFAERIYNEQPPLNSPNTWNRMRYRELEGFVMAISPFNFCAIGANLCAAPALMGNTVLWKPSNTSILSNYVTHQIFQEAGLPQGVVNFLPCDPKVASVAINHRDLGGLHFTGSTKTFNTLWSQIGSNIGNYRSYPRIVGETGGKNFHLIHCSADVQHAVNSTVRGAFEYQGQKCSATSRLYVPKSLWPEFKKQMLDKIATIHMGQPDDMSTFMTAVIDKVAFKKHSDYIEGAKASSECEIIAGGKCDSTKGYFVEPTVIVTTNPNYKTMQEEIFGPVLTVFVYDDNEYENVFKLIDNATPYALTGSFFARDRNAIVHAEQALRHNAGNFYINDKSTGAVVGEQPFGGARGSGTNDKAGSHLNLLRWVSVQTIKEYTVPLTTHTYPHME